MNRLSSGIEGGEVEALITMLDRSGVKLRADAPERLVRLGRLIHEWNTRVNLISRKDIARLVSYHFCDAASLLPIIKPEGSIDMLDLGGSNGLPGLVLSALSPNIKVTVCDSRLKRRGFMDEACAALEDAASHVIARVDSDSYLTSNAGRFDLIVARAVTRLRLLLKWCLPLLRPGGYIAAYKGSRSGEEVRQAEGYLWTHGANLVMVLGSPFADKCNPMRRFAIVGKIR
jgi:16S rRNA (guanine527-N7)-methyltransferase